LFLDRFRGEKWRSCWSDGPFGLRQDYAITKTLVEMRGGKIWIESEERRGSEFCFILPKGGS
jgi:signal transduction histidine kinase